MRVGNGYSSVDKIEQWQIPHSVADGRCKPTVCEADGILRQSPL